MSRVTLGPFTLEQFLRLPDYEPALEFLGGRIIQKMSPKHSHSAIQTEMATALNAFARPKKLGRAYTEFRAVFGGQAHVPDVSFYAAGRIPKDILDRDILIPPDLSVEILSPGQTVAELRLKLRQALKYGARLGWLIHPVRRRIYVVRPGQRVQILEIGDTLRGEDVVPGFSIPLAEIFRWLEPE